MTRMPINRKNGCKSTKNSESGFTMIELVIVLVLTSVLGIFVFQIATNSLSTLITMRTRKERADDAVLVLEKISREVKEAKAINSAINNTLIFEKNSTSSADTNKFIKFILDTSTNTLRRQSAVDLASLPGNSTSGNIVAKNVTVFNAGSEVGSSDNRIVITMELSNGAEWETKVYPRNYGL